MSVSPGILVKLHHALTSSIADRRSRKVESIYVQPNTDAESYVEKRFPDNQIKRVGSTKRPTSIEGFLNGMHIVFQPGQSKGLHATYHFGFTGGTKTGQVDLLLLACLALLRFAVR